MNVRQLVECVCAVHLAPNVEGSLQQRGGLFLVGPPGALKSTIADTLGEYRDVLILSDVNVQTLTALRDSLSSGTIRTLVFGEFPKIYERHVFTAVNVEGTLRALASEGFTSPSFEDQRIGQRRVFATIIGGVPPDIRAKHFARWESSGFNRRFLWCLYGVQDSRLLDDAASRLQRLDFGVTDIPRLPPLARKIPNLLTPAETERAQDYVAQQPGGTHTQQIQVLVRLWAVLKWWHAERGEPGRTEETVRAFAKSLRRDGTDLVLEPTTPPAAMPRRRKSDTGARVKKR